MCSYYCGLKHKPVKMTLNTSNSRTRSFGHFLLLKKKDRNFTLTFFIPTLDATLILVSFSDECFRNSLKKKGFNFQRHRISHFENTDMFPYGNIGGMQSVNNPIWRPIGLVYPKQRVNTWYISDYLASFIGTCWSFLSEKIYWFWVFPQNKKKNMEWFLYICCTDNVQSNLTYVKSWCKVCKMCWKEIYR